MASRMTKTLYYYTPPDHALANLRDGHVKVSSFAGCNDPFELAAFNMRKGARYDDRRKFRKRIRDWQGRQECTHGLICFSKTWRSPLMWAHYAGDHTGLCLEFELDETRIQPANHVLLDVAYTPVRIRQDTVPPDLDRITSAEQLQTLCATKFSRWRYERESRLLVDLRAPGIVQRCGIRFMPMGHGMRLKRIFMGIHTCHPLESIEEALGTRSVRVLQTRAAFSSFNIVLQQDRGFRKTRKTT